MLKFKTNMGTADRIIRIIVGVGLLVLGPLTEIIQITTTVRIALGAIGLFALISALTSYCLFYDITGANTLGKNQNKH